MSADLHPTVLWAQRSDNVLLTIPLQDATNVSINLSNNTFTFSCVSEGKSYRATIPLFADVVTEESSHVIRPRQIELKIKKSDVNADAWPRLTKEKVKISYIQIDWNRWKDDDDDGKDLGDFGMGGGGMSGLGGMDFDMIEKLSAAGGVPEFGSARGQEAKGIPNDLVEDEDMPPLED
ncbi:MAG: co-chaperone p23 family protein [Burkholderiales bacterium]|nr:co-chaperone p23 family protein [Burkholderiales bacterium]